MRYWLMKSEPDCYGIDHLAADNPAMWEGCRNYQVRNFMKKDMQPGDWAFFYHSSCDPPGIVGTMPIVSESYPDPTQFDPKSQYFDEKSNPEKPKWVVVDVGEPIKWPKMLTLKEMRELEELEDMWVLRRGQRLSVLPVTEEEWAAVHRIMGYDRPDQK